MQPPIPYPGPPGPIAEDAVRVFKWSFWQVFIRSYLISVVLIVSIWVFDPPASGNFDTQSIRFGIVALCGGMIAGAITTISCQYIYKVKMDDKSIVGHNAWGNSAVLKWEVMVAVNPINLAGFRYARISSSTKKNHIWLPLFVSDLKGLRDAVSHFAPALNPLREYLEKHVK